jgi:hypothetical protein
MKRQQQIGINLCFVFKFENTGENSKKIGVKLKYLGNVSRDDFCVNPFCVFYLNLVSFSLSQSSFQSKILFLHLWRFKGCREPTVTLNCVTLFS